VYFQTQAKAKISQDFCPIKDDKKRRLLSSIVGNFCFLTLKTSGRGVENSFLP
jgi:hypothetical protein